MKKKLIVLLLLIILFIFGSLLYARFISTSGLYIKEYKIESKDINDHYDGFKIVHISDIHYGRILDDKRLEEIVETINDLKPDMLVLTGDLIDRDTKLTEENKNNISNILKNIKVTTNKYAINGNHDVVFDSWGSIVENGGFINLNNKFDYVYYESNRSIFIGGLSQNSIFDIPFDDKIKPIYDELDKTSDNKPLYNILIMHEPDFIENIDLSYFDLVLAGHSHNGQVRLPFMGALILPPNAKKYYEEYYKFDDTHIYISSGIGVSNVNFRFFNRPSINLYRLVQTKS